VSADGSALLAELPGWAFAFVLVLGRVGACVMLLPGLGEAQLPAMVRAGLALCITVLVLPGVAPLMPAVPDDVAGTAGMLIAGIVTGLWLGWLTRMVVLALPVAGQIVSFMVGLSNVLQPNAELGAQATAVGTMLALAAPTIVLASGLYAPALSALDGSFRFVAPGALLPVEDATRTALGAVAQAFALSLRLAAPFLLASVVWQGSLGLLARLVPRLHVYFVAMPAQILGGLTLLAALIAVLLDDWQQAVRAAYAVLPGLG
jgi:flagellar biosynthetic protein FliR